MSEFVHIPPPKEFHLNKSQPTAEGWLYQGSANKARKSLHRVILQENAVQTQVVAYAHGQSAQTQAFYADV